MSRQIKWKMTKLETLFCSSHCFLSYLLSYVCIFTFIWWPPLCPLSSPLCWGLPNDISDSRQNIVIYDTHTDPLSRPRPRYHNYVDVRQPASPEAALYPVHCLLWTRNKTHTGYFLCADRRAYYTCRVKGLYVSIGFISGFRSWLWIILGSVLWT